MKKNVKEQQGNELFFVQIREPSEVRRSILESLKEILELLQRFEKFRHIRHDKLIRIQKLRVLIRDTNKLMGELKAKLPQTSLKGVVVKEAPKQQKKPAKKKEEQHPKKEKSELERLEAELSAIEGKLKSFT